MPRVRPPRADRGGPSADRLTELWALLTAWTLKPGAWKLTTERQKHLRARIADFDEDTVERVARWAAVSNHDRAQFLRERGDVDTLLRRENFAKYAAMSEESGPRLVATQGPTTDAEAAWTAMARTAAERIPGLPLPEPRTPQERRARQLFRELGGWDRFRGNEFARRQLQNEFIAAWSRAPMEVSP
jgi:hypothetical protein